MHKIYQISTDQQQCPTRPLAMLDCKTVAVINACNRYITIICLQTYSKRTISIKQRYWFRGSIFYFEQSRLLCTANYCKGTVNYFCLNGDNVKQFVGDRVDENKTKKYYKGDYHSLVIEGEHNDHDKLIKIHLYRVDNVQLFVSINVSSSTLYLHDTSNIWMSNPNHLWLTKQKQNNGKILQVYLQPLSLKSCENIVNSQQGIQQLVGINIGSSSIFFVKNGLSNKSVIVDNKDDSIACQSDVMFESLQFFYAPDDEKDVIVMPQFNAISNSIKITIIRMTFTYSEINLHCLVQINEDFDDDLLQDAVQLLKK